MPTWTQDIEVNNITPRQLDFSSISLWCRRRRNVPKSLHLCCTLTFSLIRLGRKCPKVPRFRSSKRAKRLSPNFGRLGVSQPRGGDKVLPKRWAESQASVQVPKVYQHIGNRHCSCWASPSGWQKVNFIDWSAEKIFTNFITHRCFDNRNIPLSQKSNQFARAGCWDSLSSTGRRRKPERFS